MFPDFRPDVKPAILSSRARRDLARDGYVEMKLRHPEEPALAARILVPGTAEPMAAGGSMIAAPQTHGLGSFRLRDPEITVHAVGRRVDFDCLPGDFAELLVPNARVVGQSYAEHKSGIWFGERLAFGGRDLIVVGAYRCGGAVIALHATVPRVEAKRARKVIEAVAGGLRFEHPDPDVLTDHAVVVALPFGLALPVGSKKSGADGGYSLVLPSTGGGAVLTVAQRQGRPMAVLGRLMSDMPSLGCRLASGGFSGVSSWPWLPQSRDRLHLRFTHAADRDGRPIEVLLAAGSQGGVGVAFTSRFVRRTEDPERWMRARAATMFALSTMRVGRVSSGRGKRRATHPGVREVSAPTRKMPVAPEPTIRRQRSAPAAQAVKEPPPAPTALDTDPTEKTPPENATKRGPRR